MLYDRDVLRELCRIFEGVSLVEGDLNLLGEIVTKEWEDDFECDDVLDRQHVHMMRAQSRLAYSRVLSHRGEEELSEDELRKKMLSTLAMYWPFVALGDNAVHRLKMMASFKPRMATTY